jgi:DNA polymerase epsilon subunit 2
LAPTSQKIITLQLWEDALKETTATVDNNEKVVTRAPRNTKQMKLLDLLANPNKDDDVATEKETARAEAYMHVSDKALPSRIKQAEWKIVDAFDTPTLKYDSLRQQLYYADKSEGRPPLFGTVEDKIDMMSQRFLRVQQRVARSVSNLTTIDRLLGTNVTSTQILLGILHATSTSSVIAEAEGVAMTSFALEDMTGSIPLQLLANARLDTRGVYTDGCIVLVEGYYEEGIFNVNKIKLPPIESKATSKPCMPPVPGEFSCDRVSTATPLSIYTMANAAVDEPVIMSELKGLVDRLAADLASDPIILVLMGNFTGGCMPLAVAMEELCRALKPLPSNHSVLIMPGPNDTPSMCWPIPAIKAPSSFSQELNAKVQFVSNPCRLRYDNHQDVLLYRQDMIQQHLQNEILSARNASRETIKDRILHSVLSQGHLLPRAPVYWNYDCALSLYPLPDLLLVGLEEGEAYGGSFFEEGCQVVAPGSQGNWAKVTLRAKRKRWTELRPMAVEFLRTEEDDTDKA